MKTKTFSVEEKQLKQLKELSKKTVVSEAKLIRIAIEDLLNDKERLKATLTRGQESLKSVWNS